MDSTSSCRPGHLKWHPATIDRSRSVLNCFHRLPTGHDHSASAHSPVAASLRGCGVGLAARRACHSGPLLRVAQLLPPPHRGHARGAPPVLPGAVPPKPYKPSVFRHHTADMYLAHHLVSQVLRCTESSCGAVASPLHRFNCVHLHALLSPMPHRGASPAD